jgi:hypothetical protein
MPLKHLGVFSLLRGFAHSSPLRPVSRRRRDRFQLRPGPEVLEPRLTPSFFPGTYVWTAKGDHTSWNDPNNWSHFGPQIGIPLTGTPTPDSDIVFPPIASLQAGSPTTINFNSTYISFPIHNWTIQGSYTFQGNPITIDGGIFVLNPAGSSTGATVLLSGLTLSRGASIYTATGSTLNLGNAGDLTGLQLILQGGAFKSGGGQLVIDTQSIFDPQIGFSLQPFEIAGGTVTLGTAMDFSGTRFQVDSGSYLVVADGAAVQVGSLAGAGVVDLAGTGAATDLTGLTARVPAGASDRFSGPLVGLGRFTIQGNGTLTTGAIDLGNAGSVQVLLGTLDVVGSMSVGTLQVGDTATFGGIGAWKVSGSAAFQAGSTFAITLDGIAPGSQYTQLIDGDSTNGINLGNSTLSASIGYEYQAGDRFTIVTGPLIQGQFQNVVNGFVLLGDNVPFSVSSTSTAVTLTALQSETTTQLSGSANPSHPGEPVTFTATVGTRTAPVTTGTVSFEEGTTVVANVPVSSSGTATFTTAALPLGRTAITAVYSGAAGVLGSTSLAWTQAVVPYPTTTSVASATNPSRPGQPVTFTAAVAAGMPVTTGTVSFTRGNQLLGIVPIRGDGTASITVSTLPVGGGRIQAVYNGSPNDMPSLSPFLIQVVDRFTTTTSLSLATQTRPNGRLRYVLEAFVTSDGAPGLLSFGTVVFRRNGRVIGRARLTNGAAVLAIGRHAPSRGTFVAVFQGGSRFRPSQSVLLKLPA